MKRVSTLAQSLPLVLAAALTSWLALLSWRGFVVSTGSFVVPLLLGIVLISATGVLARAARLPAPIVACGQVLTVLLVTNAWWGTSLFPGPESIREAVKRFDHSIDVLGQYAAPVPAAEPDAVVVLLLGGLMLHVLVDLLATTLNRVSLAGLPLLAIYTVPVSVLDGRVGWLTFSLAAGGFLVMLTLQEGRRISGWGRHFGAPPGSDRLAAFGAQDARRHPVAIGAVALVAAVLVPLAIPVLDVDVLPGSGTGSGDNDVKITNPMTDLHRDLYRGPDTPLMTVRSESRPRYFRISALTRYTGATWTPGDRDLPAAQAASGAMPLPPGLSSLKRRADEPMQIEVDDAFQSLWLPTPLVVSSVDAGSDWRYDSQILDFHSADDDITTAGMSYALTQSMPEYDAAGLARARPAPFSVTSEYATVPDDLPEMVSDLAEQVVEGQNTPYDQAVALQRWFRSPANFTYSLDPEEGAVTGNGNDALVRFLSSDGRVGYCEQFASAMAAMARSLGIPARVSVGFLSADLISSGRYQFSSHDLHAWPELYFEGFGWVMFEPTPQDRATSVPDYTQNRPDSPEPTATPTVEPTDETSSAAPSAAPTAQPEAPNPEATAASDDGGRNWWLPVLVAGLLLALLTWLALLPRLVRRRRTARRWRGSESPAEAAWLELRDTVIDLGRAWPEGRSLREAGRQLVQWLGTVDADGATARPATGPEQNPEALRALEELVGALEQERYASTAGTQTSEATAREWTASAVAGLRAGVTPQALRRATWWPASVLRRNRRDEAAELSDEPERNTLD